MQVGDKIRGFKFKSNSEHAYASMMDENIGEVGEITYIDSDRIFVEIRFKDFSWYYPLEEAKKHLVVEDEINTPSHYDNSKGTLYNVAKERGWNAYVMDVMRRLERAEKKGEFLSDIDKSIQVLELYKKEQGHKFKDEFEPLNK